MANAVYVPANVKTSLIQNRFLITGSVKLANVSNLGYTQITGVPFSLAGICPSQNGPDSVYIQSANAAGISAYGYAYRPDANGNVANGAVQIFGNGNLSAEISTGNIPTAVKNDVLIFEALISR